MKKNVVFYTDRWSSGGIESFIVNIVSGLDKEKFSPMILVAQKESNVFDRKLEENGCKMQTILNRSYKNPWKRIFANLKRFRKKIECIDIDCIHINIYNGIGLIYAYLAKKAGITDVIVHAHNSGISKDLFGIKNILHKISIFFFAKYPTKYLACSQVSADFCFGKNKKYTLINNGIDVDSFSFDKTIREEYRKKFGAQDCLIIGNVGRFVQQKNQLFLLDVFYEVKKKQKKSKMIIIGNGELKKELEKKINELGLSEDVFLLGERTDVNKLLQMMDVFCLPSLYEGLGIVLIEAQTSGLPCFISENIPSEAIVTHEVYRTALGEGPKIWADRILDISQNYRRKDNKEIIIENGYDILENVKKLEKIYW